MTALLCFLVTLFASPLKSRSRLEAENAAPRYQLIVLRRKVTGRVRVTNGDRLVFIQRYRWFPSVLKVITVIRPETLLRWHRAGFRRYWCWKSRPFGGRPGRKSAQVFLETHVSDLGRRSTLDIDVLLGQDLTNGTVAPATDLASRNVHAA